jgi:ATP-dependent DNA ligase
MVKAMTFTEISPIEAERLLDSDAWALEPKYDGVRALVTIDNGTVRILNRGGNPLSAASTNATRPKLEAAFAECGFQGAWTFDGELLDDGVMIVFDLPRAVTAAGVELCTPKTTFGARRAVLEATATVAGWDTPGSLMRVATHVTGTDKRVLHDTVAETGGEGTMLKRLDALYEEKRTRAAGFKVKFTATVDAVITGTNIDGKENASLGLVDGALVRDIGRCSLIGKPPVKIGDVVEVRYLYVGAGGRLVQPRLVRVRGDKTAVECGVDQLDGTIVNKWVA